MNVHILRMQMRRNEDVTYAFNNGCKHTRHWDDFYDDDYFHNNAQTDHLLFFSNNGKENGRLKSRVAFSTGTPTSTPSPSPSPPLPAASSSFMGDGGAVGFIEHHVSKRDTLAGVAIKYGVEVADIKKMNGLVTDLQMFALKTLQIPLPGKHPPSPCISNGFGTPGENIDEPTPPRHVPSDLFGSFQSLRSKPSQRKVSPAMNSLQGYYGLKQTDPNIASEGCEMSIYRKDASHYPEEVQYLTPLPASGRPLSSHRKSRSLVNDFLDENNGEPFEGESERANEKWFRRRQISVTDLTSNSSEMLMREDNSSGASSGITGKGLALRPNAATRAILPSDAEPGGLSTVAIGLGNSPAPNGHSLVRKSSSTPSLHDQDGGSSSIWNTSKWSLKPDLQAALSAAAITRPIFDGLPKPLTGRRNKAALD